MRNFERPVAAGFLVNGALRRISVQALVAQEGCCGSVQRCFLFVLSGKWLRA